MSYTLKIFVSISTTKYNTGWIRRRGTRGDIIKRGTGGRIEDESKKRKRGRMRKCKLKERKEEKSELEENKTEQEWKYRKIISFL
jgi:hypothetical protein